MRIVSLQQRHIMRTGLILVCIVVLCVAAFAAVSGTYDTSGQGYDFSFAPAASGAYILEAPFFEASVSLFFGDLITLSAPFTYSPDTRGSPA